jgi:excisionase family DNA binding protein
MSNEILYTVKEISEIIHTNKGYVYELIRAGLLPALKLGAFKVRKDALLQFLKENEGKDLTNPEQISIIKHI